MKTWGEMTKDEKGTRSKKCAIGSVIIAIVLIGLAVFCGMRAQKLRERCTESVTGEVISVFPAARSRLQSYLTANYSVDGATYKAEGKYSSGYSSSDTLSRKPVTVHYDPASPNVSYAAEGPRTDHMFIIIVMAVIFAVAAPAFMGQAKRIENS